MNIEFVVNGGETVSHMIWTFPDDTDWYPIILSYLTTLYHEEPTIAEPETGGQPTNSEYAKLMWQCPMCEREFGTKQGRAMHMWRAHEVKGESRR